MKKKDDFQPDWTEQCPPEGSYRSVFKWGAPDGFKHPSHKMYRYMREIFNLTDDDFKTTVFDGNDQVELKDRPPVLAKKHVTAITALVGEKNISQSDYDRLYFSTGKTQEEAFELRQNVVAEVTDLVVHPTSSDEVAAVVAYCDQNKISIYPYGGGSSVNFGFRPTKGGVTLVLRTHLNKIVEINEKNKTVKVQAGMFGPALEEELNNAIKKHGCKKNYTNGHFPQSFEYSSVGGWFVTLGSGQESSYYGDAGDLVLGVTFVSPSGVITTKDFAASAAGPKVLDMIKGSEGCFGIVTELTIKMFNYQPENRYGFSYIFPSFEAGVAACREISQGEFGFPGVMRISDPEETDMGLKLYGVADTVLDTLMKVRGFKPMERCLFLGRTCGEKQFAKNVKKKAKRICHKHGGMSLTSYAVGKWDHGRYLDPYLREDLNDYGLVLDTTEASVNWDNLDNLHQKVREYVKSRPNTGCLTHASHFYPEGTNLYFIFFIKTTDLDEYREFQSGIFEAICKNGGSLSHHHGVGRMIGPWMSEYLGKDEMNVLRVLKKQFDPNNILNSGGAMGLDYEPSDLKNHDWRIDWKKK